MDARAFLEAERRRILKIVALVLIIAAGCGAIVIGIVFALTANRGIGIIALVSVVCSLNITLSLVFIRRAPLWLVLLPILGSFGLAAISIWLFIPALGFIF